MSRAEKTLEKMRASLDGWGPDDVTSVYLHFGFIMREGANHRIFTHPDHEDLTGTCGRHRKLSKGYVNDLIKNIDALEGRAKV